MTMIRRLGTLGAAGSLCLLATSAFAHITLENQQAPVGSTYKAVMRVGHGCEGSPPSRSASRSRRGSSPSSRCPSRAGTSTRSRAPTSSPTTTTARRMTEGVREIVWTGRLLDKHYDEFVFRAYLTDGLKPDTMLYFPAVQECEKGAERWIEIPAEGKGADDYKSSGARPEAAAPRPPN